MNRTLFKRLRIFFTLVFFLFCSINTSEGSEKVGRNASPVIRPPAVSGSFYPSSPDQLTGIIRQMLEEATIATPDGEIVAATAPHAGYVYSGRIAALTFKQLQNVDFDTLVIIGHDAGRGAVAFTSPADYFRTPLGDIALDREMIEKMEEYNRGIRPNASIHANDHTIEIQLPFLQVMDKKCRIVPIMFGDPSAENCRILLDAINASKEDKKIFILASTDMSHYPASQLAYKYDNETLKIIKEMNLDRFFSYLRRGMRNNNNPELRTLICASGGVGTAIIFAGSKGAKHVLVQKYANSGDVPGGDKSSVVGYSSVLFVQ